MNANELADLIGLCGDGGYNQDAATMLRQQADLIRNLQKSLGFKNSGYETINLTPPVAWMDEETGCFVYSQYDYEDLDEHGKDGLIPLYTHPAETITLAELRKTELYRTEQTRSLREFLEPKALTDEEIQEIAHGFEAIGWMGETTYDFARAILRKAKEK